MITVLLTVSSQAQQTEDQLIFRSFLEYARNERLAEKETGERVAAIGCFFIGTPYVGGTLEADGPECLQINLRGLDCTTLVENVLALNLMLQSEKTTFDTFKEKLTLIRYRDGILDQYPSRLHYTSDWIGNNLAKGLIKVVCMGDSAMLFPLQLNFMSTHPEYYPALEANTDFVAAMAAHETRINDVSRLMYLPKERVRAAGSCIQTGDIIAITTGTPGLDYSHLGLAIRDKNGQVYLLHASSAAKKVVLSDKPLSDYLLDIKRHTGITVVRPL